MEMKHASVAAENTMQPITPIIQNSESTSGNIFEEEEYWGKFEKSPYKDGWPEHKWRDEIEKHPFFMTKSPDPEEELSPLIQGLQQLKYDENENTPDELANTYKDDGNFYFKCKKYRDAITNYEAGLKLKCSNELRAQLLNNRAASHFFLQNFKSALNDSEATLKLDPNYSKAKIRIAHCYYHLEKYEYCIKTCDDILFEDKDNSAMKKLKEDAVSKQKLKNRDLRKQVKRVTKQTAEDELLLQTIKNRKINVNIKGIRKLVNVTDLDPDLHVPAELNRVYLENGKLFWPVVLCYPELTFNVPITDFDEDCTFETQLRIVFQGCNELNAQQKYLPENINIYFKNQDLKPFKFSVHLTLRETLSDSRFMLDCGVPVFFVLYKNSQTEKDFVACK